MAWTAPKTWSTNEVLSAFDLNTYLRDNMLLTLPALATQEYSYFVSDGENRVAERKWAYQEILSVESTTSTTYTDLTTPGPSVTVTSGAGGALVMWVAHVTDSTGPNANASVQITGASEDEAEAQADDERSNAAIGHEHFQTMQTVFYDGLNEGENTFTMKYRVDSGTGTFRRRRLLVFPF